MEFTIGWNNGQHTYLVQMYVQGFDIVHVSTSAPMQVVYLIKIMKEVYPIRIGWHHSMPQDIKDALVQTIRENVAV